MKKLTFSIALLIFLSFTLSDVFAQKGEMFQVGTAHMDAIVNDTTDVNLVVFNNSLTIKFQSNNVNNTEYFLDWNTGQTEFYSDGVLFDGEILVSIAGTTLVVLGNPNDSVSAETLVRFDMSFEESNLNNFDRLKTVLESELKSLGKKEEENLFNFDFKY
jgi:hypothetical protein